MTEQSCNVCKTKTLLNICDGCQKGCCSVCLDKCSACKREFCEECCRRCEECCQDAVLFDMVCKKKCASSHDGENGPFLCPKHYEQKYGDTPLGDTRMDAQKHRTETEVDPFFPSYFPSEKVLFTGLDEIGQVVNKKDIYFHSVVGYIVNNTSGTLEKYDVFCDHTGEFYECTPFYSTSLEIFRILPNEFCRYSWNGTSPTSSIQIVGKLKESEFGQDCHYDIYCDNTVYGIVPTCARPDEFTHFYVQDGFKIFIYFDENKETITDLVEFTSEPNLHDVSQIALDIADDDISWGKYKDFLAANSEIAVGELDRQHSKLLKHFIIEEAEITEAVALSEEEGLWI
jgi:hypothetical protein